MHTPNLSIPNDFPAGTPCLVPLADHLSLTFIWCPPGEFLMGSRPDDPYGMGYERPQHLVTITQGFWISQTIITCEQWRLLEPQARIPTGGEKFPAQQTTWDDAAAFCIAMTEDLHASGALPQNLVMDFPTEEEWEYACRAGTKTTWYFGDDESLLADHAWYKANSDNRQHPVGLKLPNPWGLYDVYGNAEEWCRENTYHYRLGKTAIPRVDLHRATRGGDYGSPSYECTSAGRSITHRHNEFNDAISLRPVLRSNAS